MYLKVFYKINGREEERWISLFTSNASQTIVRRLVQDRLDTDKFVITKIEEIDE